MLRKLIIGGVALAATGYGLKKYIDANDKHDLVDNVSEKMFDCIDKVGEKANGFFDTLIKRLDEQEEKNILKKIDSLKDIFYTKRLPLFLECFEKTKNLPKFDIGQFYQLQKEYKKIDITLESIDSDTKESLVKFYEIYGAAINFIDLQLDSYKYYGIDKMSNLFSEKSYLNKVLDGDIEAKNDHHLYTLKKNIPVDDLIHDYSTYSKEQKVVIENIYLIVNMLVGLYSTDIIGEDKKFSKKTKEQILMLEKLLESSYYSLKKSEHSTTKI